MLSCMFEQTWVCERVRFGRALAIVVVFGWGEGHSHTLASYIGEEGLRDQRYDRIVSPYIDGRAMKPLLSHVRVRVASTFVNAKLKSVILLVYKSGPHVSKKCSTCSFFKSRLYKHSRESLLRK
jgi:hypothetical protein